MPYVQTCMIDGGSPSNTSAAIGPGAFRLALAGVVVLDHFYGVLLGRAAVYVFFVLSGYWITKMWSSRYTGADAPYLTYMTARLWRLAPTMLVSSAFAVLVAIAVLKINPLTVSGVDPAHQIFSHLFFLGYSQLPTPRLLDPAWSLDIEMRFYLVAPFLILVMERYGLRVFVALVLCASALQTVIPASGLGFLALFAAGMIAAKKDWRPSRRLSTGSLLAIAALFAGLYLSGHSGVLTDRGLHDANTALSWVLAGLAAPYAIATCHEPGGERDRMFGDLSYSVYLIHWPVVVMMHAAQGATGLTALACVALSFGLAFLALNLVDQPLQTLRARWVSFQPKARAAVEAVS